MNIDKEILINLNNKDNAFLDGVSNLQKNAFEKVDYIINEILDHNDELKINILILLLIATQQKWFIIKF